MQFQQSQYAEWLEAKQLMSPAHGDSTQSVVRSYRLQKAARWPLLEGSPKFIL